MKVGTALEARGGGQALGTDENGFRVGVKALSSYAFVRPHGELSSCSTSAWLLEQEAHVLWCHYPASTEAFSFFGREDVYLSCGV